MAKDDGLDWFPVLNFAPQQEAAELTIRLTIAGPDLGNDGSPVTLRVFRVRELGS